MAPPGTVEQTVRATRTIVAALLALSFVLAGVLRWLPRPSSLAILELPAVLVGAVAPVIGYRVHAMVREGVSSGEPSTSVAGRYRRAVWVPVAISGGAAVLGAVAFVATDEPLTLIGLATHVLLAGALWPSVTRYELFDAARRQSGGGTDGRS